MYDISKINIGNKFYKVTDIYEFLELEVIDKNEFGLEVIIRNMLTYAAAFSHYERKSIWLKPGKSWKYFETFDDAEQAFLNNMAKKRAGLREKETLLYNLYDLAFHEVNSIEADLCQKHINTILYLYNNQDS
jgi:hypothetical protein